MKLALREQKPKHKLAKTVTQRFNQVSQNWAKMANRIWTENCPFLLIRRSLVTAQGVLSPWTRGRHGGAAVSLLVTRNGSLSTYVWWTEKTKKGYKT